MKNWLVNWDEVETAFTELAPRQDNYSCRPLTYDPRTYKYDHRTWCIKASFNDLEDIMIRVNREDVPSLDEARNWAYWMAVYLGKTPKLLR